MKYPSIVSDGSYQQAITAVITVQEDTRPALETQARYGAIATMHEGGGRDARLTDSWARVLPRGGGQDQATTIGMTVGSCEMGCTRFFVVLSF